MSNISDNGSSEYLNSNPFQASLITREKDSTLNPDLPELVFSAGFNEAIPTQSFLREQGGEFLTIVTNPEHARRGYAESKQGHKTIKKELAYDEGEVTIVPVVSTPIQNAVDPAFRELMLALQDHAIFKHEGAKRVNGLEITAQFIIKNNY